MQQVIQNLPTGVFLVMLAFAAAFVTIPLVAAVKARREMQAVTAVEAISIADADVGYIRVAGTARQLEGLPVTAALTDADVVWYHSRVEDSRDPYGKSHATETWRTIVDDESDVEFVVQDPTGVMLTYPAGARVTPTDKSIWYGATPEPQERNPKKFGPNENPTGSVDSAGSVNRYRYTEARIYPGDRIYVQGDCADCGDDATPAPRQTSGRIALAIARPRHREPFLISTTGPEAVTQVYQGSVTGGQIIAAVFAMLLVGLLWLRFS